MTITPEIRAEIQEAHARNPQRFSPFRTASALGVPIEEVMEEVKKLTEKQGAGKQQFDGFGKPELREHLVGRRKAMSAGWDNTDPEIAAARAAHEAGTHVMTTGRDGPWLLLYSIPRKGKPQPAPRYFSLETF